MYHLCFIQPDVSKHNTKSQLFVFFDFETRQEKVLEESLGKVHEPNLCAFNQRCSSCFENTELLICNICGIRQHILRKKCVQRFVEYILNQRILFKKIICIAHNGQAFDHQFVLQYLFSTSSINPEIIQRGTKI